MKGNTLKYIKSDAKLRCTVTEYKVRDAGDDTIETHITMYTTPDHEPVALELAEDYNKGSIY